MKKNIIALFAVLTLASCGVQKDVISHEETTELSQETISVTSSIIPISSVINAIGGDFVKVNTIIPAGVTPHAFDLSTKDVVALEESEITFLVGLEQIDGFLEKPLKNKKHVKLAEGMKLLEASAHDHSAHEEHEDEHEEHNVDPHVWLGKANIIAISEKVRDELSLILPDQAEYFAKNTEAFKADIENIYADFMKKNEGKTPKEFIVFHDAYNYMLQSANIEINLKIPFSQNVRQQMNAAHMTELIEEIEIHGIKNIFREPQFSYGSLQKFAERYNLTVSILDPLGTDTSASGYLENLKTNLDNLSIIYE